MEHIPYPNSLKIARKLVEENPLLFTNCASSIVEISNTMVIYANACKEWSRMTPASLMDVQEKIEDEMDFQLQSKF